MIYILLMILFLIGLYGVMIKQDLIRIALGIILIEFSTEIFLVLLGEKTGITILIELAVAVLLIALVARTHDRYQCMDISRIRELKG